MNISPTKQAQANTYSCRLVYFILLGFDMYYLYLYDTPLKTSIHLLSLYFSLIAINIYLFLTTGKNPGFAPAQKEQEELFTMAMNQNVCQLCMCIKKLRMKHCYECGRCVYKFDHHCTWIGGCVGEFNHGRFWVFCFFQTIQAICTLKIYTQAIGNYNYQQKDSQQYNGAYGAILVMIILMVLYVLFVGGMLAFHSYLIFMNTTTYQSTKFSKLSYMKKTLFPFYHGIIKNLRYTFCHPKILPIEWQIQPTPSIINSQSTTTVIQHQIQV